MIRGLLHVALRVMIVVSCAIGLMCSAPAHAQCEPDVIWHDGGRPLEMRVRGNFAYYAYQREVRVYNIANPEAPFVVGRVITPGAIVSMDIVGDYLYGASEDTGIRIINIATPAQPVHVRIITTQSGQPANEVAVVDGLMSVLCSNTIEFFSLSTPDRPVWSGSYTPSQSPTGIASEPGRTHIVTDGGASSNLLSIDVTQPATPFVFQTIPLLLDAPKKIALQNNLLAIHGRGGVWLFEKSGNFYYHRHDFASGMGPSDYNSQVTLADIGGQTLLHYPYDAETLWTYNVTQPASPVYVSSLALNPFVPLKDLAVKHSLLHILSGSSIETWDYATTPPILRHTLLQVPSSPDDLASTSGGLLIASNDELWFMDLQDSSHPTTLAYTFPSTSTYMNSVVTEGDLAFTAGSQLFASSLLSIFDASNPQSLSLLGSVLDTASDTYYSLRVRNNFVYCTGEDLVLCIYDATDPGHIVELGSIRDTNLQGRYIHIDGDAAYVSTDDGRLRLIDISNPQDPREVSIIPPETEAANVFALAMNGPYAYTSAARLFDPINIYDLRDLNAPVLLSSIVPPADVASLEAFDSLLMFTYYGSDAGFINVANPAEPELLPDTLTLTFDQFYNTIREAAVVNNNIWGLADGIYEVRMPLLPRVRSQIASQVVCGTQQSASFTVDIANPIGCVVRWLYNDAPLQDGTQPNGAIVSGASTSTLTITNVGPAQVGQYSCRITNLCGQSTTGSAQLVLSTSPVITEHPQTVFACAFQSGTFDAAYAPVTANTRLRWQAELSPGVFEDVSDIVSVRYAISGAMTGSLTISALGGNSLPSLLERRYRLKVTNGCGTTYTDAAMFRVQQACCDSIDFNNDSSIFDPQDIAAFFSVYSEGPCIPHIATCNDIDFNNDGGLFDPCDILAFLLRYSEGPCTMCSQ